MRTGAPHLSQSFHRRPSDRWGLRFLSLAGVDCMSVSHNTLTGDVIQYCYPDDIIFSILFTSLDRTYFHFMSIYYWWLTAELFSLDCDVFNQGPLFIDCVNISMQNSDADIQCSHAFSDTNPFLSSWWSYDVSWIMIPHTVRPILQTPYFKLNTLFSILYTLYPIHPYPIPPTPCPIPHAPYPGPHTAYAIRFHTRYSIPHTPCP